MTPPWGGSVRHGLEPVRDAFCALLDSGAETGAAFCAFADGGSVVDLWGGWSDADRTRPWQPDTLTHTFSVSKPFAALPLLVLAGRGLVDLDGLVADAWPEYAAAGKHNTTLRHVLSHQAGLPAFARETEGLLLQPSALRASLARAAPEWVPGSARGEHALTYGHLLDGICRGAVGRSLGELFDTEVATPLHLDAFFGVPPDQLGRVADLELAQPDWPVTVRAGPESGRDRALARPAGALDVTVLNSAGWRRAQFPAIGLHTTAHSVARFYDELAAPTGAVARLLGPDVYRQLLTSQTRGPDRVLGNPVSWGLGVQLDNGAVGMGGIGGSLGMLAPDKGYAVGYVTRRLDDHTRVDVLLGELDRCLSRA